jgi:hypothetical protein
LAEWDLSAFDDTVSLLVSELVTNGVRHAGTTLELVLSFDKRAFALPSPTATRGRRWREIDKS